MRVLMFGWEFPPHNSGGLGVACLGLAQALVNEHVDISFVLPRRMDVLRDHNIRFLFADVPDMMTIHEIDSALSPYLSSRDYELMQEIGGGMYGSTLFEEIKRYAQLAGAIAEKEEFDVIHAHDWLAYLAGVEAKCVSGKPLILHVHATSFDQSGRSTIDQRQYDIEKYGMEKADVVITVSQFTKDIVVNEHGIDPRKVKVVHNGLLEVEDHIEDEQVNDVLALKDAGYKIVLFLGRLTIQKGPDYFLKAAKRVLEFEPKTMFIVAGSGDMEWQMIRETAALGISRNVIFAGFVRGRQRDCLYRSADLYVMPSVSEPFGLVPLESLQKQTPVLISKQSGVSEVLTHALKVDFWDTDEMANQILSVLDHPGLQSELQKNGTREAFTVTWEKAAKKVKQIYKSLFT